MSASTQVAHDRQERIASLRTNWLDPLLVIALAVALRLVFFRGAVGSDETVYLTQGYHLLHGVVSRSSYIGAIRYGINIVEALQLWLFGPGVFGADALFFACSIGEVLLAFYFARSLWGPRAALWAGLSMAVLPIDVALAGSLNPDCYLGLTIAASVVIFYYAEQGDRPLLYAIAGLTAGWVFWIKEAVIVYGLVFPAFVLAKRRWRTGYWWFIAGGVTWLLLNLLFFTIFYGDPIYVLQVLDNKAISTVASTSVSTSIFVYPKWLYIQVYHVGLVGWLASAGGILALYRKDQAARFVLIWAAILLCVFSVFPISFSPLDFIAKQANYMLIFLMPFTLLSGWFLAQQRGMTLVLLGGLMIFSGVTLSAMEQQVIRVASVNGKAAAAFADAHSGVPVFGPATAQRESILVNLLRGSLSSTNEIRPAASLAELSPGKGPPEGIIAYVVDDPQMRLEPDWSRRYHGQGLPLALQGCLVDEQTLAPASLGFGRTVIHWLREAASLAPGFVARPVLVATDQLWRLAPAHVYAVTRGCLERNEHT